MLYYSTCRANRWIPKYTVISIQCIHYPLVSYCSTSFWKCRGCPFQALLLLAPRLEDAIFILQRLLISLVGPDWGLQFIPLNFQCVANLRETASWSDLIVICGNLWVSLFWILFCEATPGVVHSTWCYWPASFAKRIWSHGLSESPIKSMSTCIGFSLVERRHAVLKPLLSEGGK